VVVVVVVALVMVNGIRAGGPPRVKTRDGSIFFFTSVFRLLSECVKKFLNFPGKKNKTFYVLFQTKKPLRIMVRTSSGR
jgi:hypothetical protein